MSPKLVTTLKVAAVVLIGACVAILLAANKIASSIVLTITAVVILLPTSKSQWAQWCRLAFMVAAFAFIMWNISTTEYPARYHNTGFKFFDQLQYIFDMFLENAFGTQISR